MLVEHIRAKVLSHRGVVGEVGLHGIRVREIRYIKIEPGDHHLDSIVTPGIVFPKLNSTGDKPVQTT